MAKLSFKKINGNQLSLFPENIYDRIPSNHPVRLIDKVVDSLDISFIISTYKGGGNSAYAPKMMLKVLFYAYFNNIYSSRKIAKALQENIYFMWLSGHSTPDFRTINNFRGKRLKNHIHKIFSEIVLMLSELGYVSLKKQYIDGTKIEATSNKYTFVWRKSVEKNQEKLKAKVKNIIKEIESQIKQDNQENDYELPENIDSEFIVKRVEKINKELKKKPEKKIAKQLKEIKKELPRLRKYEQQLKTLGKRNSYSKTDEDATFMRMKDDHMKNGQLKPGYNIQLSTEQQFITYFSLYQTTADTTCLIPHLKGFKNLYNKQSELIVADAGYGSEENYEYLENNQIEAYVKYNYFHKEQKRKFQKDIFHPSKLYYNIKEDYFVCPMGQKMKKIKEGYRTSANGYRSKVSYYQAINCSSCPLRGSCHKSNGNRTIEINHRLNKFRNQAKKRLLSEKGLYYRSKRPIEVEAVFGQLKFNNKFTRFTLRGLKKVNIEVGLMAIAHNLRKLWALKSKEWLFFNQLLNNFLFIFEINKNMKQKMSALTLPN